MMPIYFLRHGETVWNKAQRLQGGLDSPLTNKGVQQASAMGAALLNELGPCPDCLLVSSPLGRALTTARIVGEILGLSAEVDARLSEITMGSWDGLTHDEVRIKWPHILQGTTEKNWYFHSPDGETLEEVRIRAASWLADVRRPTIAVAHGLFGKVLRGIYSGLSSE
jgi:probable phosphoglycerate mutase